MKNSNFKSPKSYKFDYDLGGLQTYTDQLSSDIISEAVLSPITMSYVNTVSGIKGSQNVNLLSETLSVQTGTTCGFQDSGDVEFSTVTITVQPFKVNQQLCQDQLNSLWLGQYLNSGSYAENIPFEQAIIDLQTRQIKRYNEDLLWNATVSGGNTFNGYKQIIQNATGATRVTGSTALCSVTGATVQEKAYNVLAQVDRIVDAINRNVFQRDDIIIYMSLTQFKCYLTALRNVNNFFIDTRGEKLGQVYEVYHPQTNFKVVGCPGLDASGGSNMIAAVPMQYMLAGVDLLSDEDEFRAWYSLDNQATRIVAKWKLGTTIAFPEFIVHNGLA
jgi:hypothetical protein